MGIQDGGVLEATLILQTDADPGHETETGDPDPVIGIGDPDLVTVKDHGLDPVTVIVNAANGLNRDHLESPAAIATYHLQNLQIPKMKKSLVVSSTPQRLTKRRQRSVWKQKC